MFSISQHLLPYVLLYKYYAIFIITFWGAFLLPLPSGTVIIAAAAFATQGYMNLWLVWLAGLLGNMSGDSLGYFLAWRYGPPLLRKIGFKHVLNSKTFENTKDQIDEHPIITIYTSRFMTAVAPAVNIISGLGKIRYLHYLTFEALGELTEVSLWVLIGWYFGSQWELVNQLSSKFIWIIFVGIIFSYFFLHRVIMRKPKKK